MTPDNKDFTKKMSSNRNHLTIAMYSFDRSSFRVGNNDNDEGESSGLIEDDDY